jgi:hypothetical protein
MIIILCHPFSLQEEGDEEAEDLVVSKSYSLPPPLFIITNAFSLSGKILDEIGISMGSAIPDAPTGGMLCSCAYHDY